MKSSANQLKNSVENLNNRFPKNGRKMLEHEDRSFKIVHANKSKESARKNELNNQDIWDTVKRSNIHISVCLNWNGPRKSIQLDNKKKFPKSGID